MDTTLDARGISQAVVQLGGFASAIKKLNLSQSTIGYAIGRLQEKLPIRLDRNQRSEARQHGQLWRIAPDSIDATVR